MFRLAWRNLWRQPRRTWLTTGAMVFSNVLLVFLISLQFGMYQMMIENTLQAFTGHLQVQAPGYKDEQKMRQSIPAVAALATSLREGLDTDTIAARGFAFALASSAERSYGVQVVGVEPRFEPGVSSLPGLIDEGRYLNDGSAAEIVIGTVLARNLRVGVGDELTLLGSGRDGSFRGRCRRRSSASSTAACRIWTEALPRCRSATSRTRSPWETTATAS